MSKKDSTRIIADPYLCFTALASIIYASLVVIPIIYFMATGTSRDEKQSAQFLLAEYLFFVLLIILNFNKYCIVISLNKNSIRFKAFLKKNIEKQYWQYGYIYYTTYSHFGYQIRYIVFSQIKLDDKQLTHINRVKASDKIIKIRMRNRIRSKLENFLPKEYIKLLKKQGW